MSSKGVTLVQGQVAILALDGTLVYVEEVANTHASVVALPDQPAKTDDGKASVFTPGKVGAKKISPFSQAEKVIDVADLSDRNKNFIGTYEQLRKEHGANYIGDDALRAAAEAAANSPTKEQQKALDRESKKADREARKAEKAAKKTAGGPRYLQRCAQCGEQSGHPNHPGDHEFVAPPPPVVLCAACDKAEDAMQHQVGDEAFTHRFIAPGKPARAPKEPKAPREPRAPKEPSARRSSKSLPAPDAKYRYVENETALKILVAANGKFDEKNSGGAIITIIKNAGAAGASVVDVMQQQARPLERLQLAFAQLLGAGLLEAVS